MPKKDLNDFKTLLADLWRELSPTVRLFLFLGFAVGGLAGLGSFSASRRVPGTM